MCLETVYSILGYWNYPLTNILGDTGCHIANLLRVTGGLETQFHSFIMATTRYLLLFHDNRLLRFNLTPNVSAITPLRLNFNMTQAYFVFCHYIFSWISAFYKDYGGVEYLIAFIL